MTLDPEFAFNPWEEEEAHPWPDEEPFNFTRGMLLGLPLSGLLWVGIYFAWRALW